MRDHILDVQFDDLHCTLTLPDYFPLEAVMDLGEYLTPPMRLFNPLVRTGNRISFVLPRICNQMQQEKFVELLMAHAGCWLSCYPKKVEELQAQMIGPRLRVVPNPI